MFSMTSRSDYAQVPSKDEGLESGNLQHHNLETRHYRKKIILIFLCGVSLGVAAACGLQFFLQVHLNSQMPTSDCNKPINQVEEAQAKTTISYDVNTELGFVINPNTGEAKCGNNWQEAKQLGCHYDVLASRWYSDECYNGEVMETMLKEVDFQWYQDPEHKRPVTWEVARSGEFDALWPLHDFHIMHCLYLWRRLHSALVEHRHLDDDVYSYGHTLHCTRLIMQWPKEWKYGKNTTTIATSGRPFCRNEPL